MSDVTDQRYSVSEVARILRLHKATIYRLIQSGRLAAERHGGVLRVTGTALAAYLATTVIA